MLKPYSLMCTNIKKKKEFAFKSLLQNVVYSDNYSY